jgi:thioredoxin 2
MSFSVTRVCEKCGTQNRIPAKHLTHTGRCGACKADLTPQSEPLSVDSAAFDAIVGEVQEPILADFWAQWCGPCRASAPDIQLLAHEFAGRAVILKVDTDAEQSLAARFKINSVPTFVALHRGAWFTPR